MRSPAPEADDMAAAAARARSNPDLLAELAALYRQVDAELADAGQTCRTCGKCCDFRRYGHRLYLTTIEAAMLASEPPAHPQALAEGLCPYQDGTLCTARDRRALGCRVFSCDASNDPFEHDLYSRYHRRIKEMHSTYSIMYCYVDIIASLLPSQA